MYKQTILLTGLFLLSQFTCLFAQQTEAIFLSGPEDWRLEKISLPMGFAPEMTYEGFEELRFAPGMFDRSSATYFTYVFAASIDNNSNFEKKEIDDFLIKYYRGLSEVVGKSKELKLDYSEIQVTIKRKKRFKQKTKIYTIQINYFDTFNKGEKILLNMELEVKKDKKANKSYLLALVSPDSKQSDVWKKLYQIREGMRANLDKHVADTSLPSIN